MTAASNPASGQPVTRMPALGDPDETALVTYLNKHVWEPYAQVRRPWLRQVEENVRALSGRQFDTYLESMGQFVDLSTVFAPADERWRRTPVFNWLGQHWYQSALAKLTENIPSLGAIPATADQKDATLAAIFDPVFKYEWDQMRMPQKRFRAIGWLLTAGRYVLKLRWDPDRGPREQFLGPGSFTFGGEVRQLSQAPYVRQADGSFGVNLTLGPDGQPQMGPDGQPLMGPPHVQWLGDLDCQVIAPTSILQPYGPELPQEKPWIMHEYLLPIETIADRFGVKDVEPDVTGVMGNDLLLKMEYTSAYGMPNSLGGGFGPVLAGAHQQTIEGMARVRERWERACPQYPYGRLSIVTLTRKLYDDINPYVVPGVQDEAVIPFYLYDKPGFPFRQEGSSDLEALIPVARAFNRSMGGQMDAADYNEQPTLMINKNAIGDDQDENFNTRGGRVYSDLPVGDNVARYLEPPKLPESSREMAASLMELLQVLGHTAQTEGTVANDARSGELLQQNRFDQDRPWGATLRLHSYVDADLAKDMMTILGACMDDDRMLAIAGEDNAAAYLSVRGDMFQGRINVVPNPESAVLESRQDKQRRLLEMFTAVSQMLPPYADMYLKAVNFPELTRALRPGGEAYSLAVRQVAEMLTTAALPPVIPEQDHGVHIQVATEAMQTRAFRDAPPPVQQALRIYVMLHKAAGAQQQIQSTTLAAGVAGKQGQLIRQAQQHAMPAQAAPPEGDAPAGPGQENAA